MPKGPRGWAPVNSARYNILHPHAESYLKHQQSGTLGVFFPNVYQQYFSVFHYTLSDDQDPNPETVYAEPETDEEKKKKVALMKVMKDVCVLIYCALRIITHLNHSALLGGSTSTTHGCGLRESVSAPLLPYPQLLAHRPLPDSQLDEPPCSRSTCTCIVTDLGMQWMPSLS